MHHDIASHIDFGNDKGERTSDNIRNNALVFEKDVMTKQYARVFFIISIFNLILGQLILIMVAEIEQKSKGKFMAKSKYDFYEIVKVSSTKENLAKINGCEGAILGMAEENGNWFYAIQILSFLEDGWDVEEDILPTGKKMSREDFYSGESVTVEVDPITGEGEVKS